jgi:hypothetical protein
MAGALPFIKVGGAEKIHPSCYKSLITAQAPLDSRKSKDIKREGASAITLQSNLAAEKRACHPSH